MKRCGWSYLLGAFCIVPLCILVSGQLFAGEPLILTDGRRLEDATILKESATTVTIRHKHGVEMVSKSLLLTHSPTAIQKSDDASTVKSDTEVEADLSALPNPEKTGGTSGDPAPAAKTNPNETQHTPQVVQDSPFGTATITTISCFLVWLMCHLIYRSKQKGIALRHKEVVSRYIEEFGDTESGRRFITESELAIVEDNSWILNPYHRIAVQYSWSGDLGRSVYIGLIGSLAGHAANAMYHAVKNRGKTPDQRRLEEELWSIAVEYTKTRKGYEWIVVLLVSICLVTAIVVYVRASP